LTDEGLRVTKPPQITIKVHNSIFKTQVYNLKIKFMYLLGSGDGG